MTEVAVRAEYAGRLAQLEQARALLESCRDWAEVNEVRARAEALKEYARAKNLGTEALQHCQVIINRAERRLGQLLTEVPRDHGRRYERESVEEDSAGAERSSSTQRTAWRPAPPTPRQQAGRKLSARSQRIAALPEDIFEANVTASPAYLAALGSRHHANARLREAPPPLPGLGTFPVLYADPPWRYEFTESPSRAIENHYPTMSLDEIKALEVPAADDAVLFLWATPPKLAEAQEVLAAWGFTYRTGMVWVKDRIGMGRWARQRHEHLLIAVKGSMPLPLKPIPDSVIEAPRGEHSAKPEAFRQLIEDTYPGLAYCELFARTAAPGWATWGLEAPAGREEAS